MSRVLSLLVSLGSRMNVASRLRGLFTCLFWLGLLSGVLPVARGASGAPVWLPQVNHWAGNTGGKGGIDANADVISNMICDMAVLNAGDLNDQFAKYAPLVITKSYWDETNWADGAYSAGKRVSKGEFFYKDITFDSSTFGGITATIAHPHVLDTNHSPDDPNLTPQQRTDMAQLGAENQGISLAKYPDNLPYVALSDGRTITSIAYPTSVAFDRDGYLWVADNGPEQNFKIFSVPATGAPTVVATFGETGGVFAGPVSGRAGPLRFWGPRGVGFGDNGEIIVGCSGIPGQVQGGTDVRWFMPTDTSSLAQRLATATLQHQARGMFLHVGDFAPGTNGTELHTESVRYTMDYSKKPGESWAFSAVTLDPFRYPDDPRAQMPFGTTYIKQIGGKKFLYCTDMYYRYIAVFRFEEDSEIAIPCAFFYCYISGQGEDWAAGKYPTWTEGSSGWRYMWRDSNGNGQVEAGEFGTYDVPNPYSECYDVDADGNIWMGGGQSEYSAYFKCGGNWVIPCTGVDANGVPMYDLTAIEKLDVPQSLLRPEDYSISRAPTRMRYLPETDTLFLGVSQDSWRTRRIYVIDGYRHGSPTLRCMIDTGYDSNNETDVHLDQGTVTMVLPFSFAADNEYVYVGYLTGGRDTLSRGEITIYSATDGHQIGWLRPDADTNWFCGTVDLVVGLQVTTLADGSRVICEEDDGAGKVMVFHWDPKAPPSNAMIITTERPAALACTRDHDGTLQLATTGGALSWSIPAIAATGGPVHGTATVNSTGLVRYTPAAGYSGLDTFIVQVTNAQGVRDSIKVACTVSAPTTATVTLGGLSQTYNGSARPVTVTTVPAGLTVNVTYSGSATVPVNAGSYSVVATVADPNYEGSASGTLNVAKASSTITWSAPAGITYGTALSSTQLNATASVPGTFTYTPAAGTVLHAGSAQTLQAAFTPTDTANYATATKTVTLSVAKAPLVAQASDQQRTMGAANPALDISYSGFVNGDTVEDLDTLPTASTTATTASAAGQYAITLSGGSDGDYAFTLRNGTLTVTTKAVPVLTWSAPAGIVYGTALSSTQLNATASVPGTFTYTPAAGTVLHAGSGQTLQATFTPTDKVNYATATKSVTLSVAKAPLIAQADNQQRAPGTANPTLGISYSGFVNGDTVASIDVLPTASTTATTASAAGSYPITLSGGSDGDYAFTLRDGTLTVMGIDAPQYTRAPQPATVAAGGRAVFGVTVTSARTLTYQWQVSTDGGTTWSDVDDGPIYSGARSDELAFTARPEMRGRQFRCVVSDGVNPALASAAAPLTVPWSQFSALSARAAAGTGEQTLTLGFVFAGGGKPAMVRGVGPGLLDGDPTLAGHELGDPQLKLFEMQSGAFALLTSNDNWGGASTLSEKFAELGQGALARDSKDAALYLETLGQRVYTAQISGVSGTGVALAEAYDADFADKSKRLTALSVRNQVGTGSEVLIAGFVVSGDAPKRVIVRGVGPGLAKDVAAYLADPQLLVHRLKADRTGWDLVGSNDNWDGTAATAELFESVGMGALDAGSKDAALVLELEPGIYTAQISGVGDSTGVALAEIYEAP